MTRWPHMTTEAGGQPQAGFREMSASFLPPWSTLTTGLILLLRLSNPPDSQYPEWLNQSRGAARTLRGLFYVTDTLSR